ncbi:MAG: tRNA (adenosine(37)-N6)-threonylcarbamoyltransferase complex dimerization subunit type 1 TsaB [Candidatus Doudnabacteria bacterium]|nr:tRNA (adenosine(37)-N6)-threonylcarbamoyltransferase complex dimerization subunit type 1 TsaB [Candidatus Doudnabacteria bacterium]
MTLLYIDTTDNKTAEAVLVSGQNTISEKFSEMPHAEDFAAALKKFLASKKLKLKDLDRIAVRVGPGFFSRVRTGVVAANALAYGLNIPVVPVRGRVDYKKIQNSKGQRMAAPFYGAKPHITKSKKR